MPEGPAPAPVIQRLRVRYAKRGRLRFTSHRDISRAVERAVRRAGIPVAFSAGFTPHPKISYAGAAATGVASEAEYLEIGLTETRDPARVRDELDAALPAGLDIVDVVPVRAGRAGDAPVRPGAFTDRLQASRWRIRLDGVSYDDAAAAVAAFLDAGEIEVERLTKKGRRRFDVRAAVQALEAQSPEPDRRAAEAADAPCAILRMVVRHSTPAVRPDDILTGLRQVADLAPPSPPLVTRLAQGPLDAATGGLADPLDPDRESGLPSGDDAETARDRTRPQPGDAASADAVSA
ncbi:TIGR03936 family radical SAM-associated protein [Actinomadura sp. NEAU-AAG7]|uniref:TIGR03936 family radical SAM-associated protein n=1 Tax=Actinomadura sp. NEAU-AAG7 TaxID=2839640 RepID=UPI001BE3DE07|nr:TIGR03936 family radical SAM-associated protein [Actinomadura sp. NEAU-AAG7]MBT2213565.1 TIGR03936 family radical SAM-associated protein [Actinomadura sp. NEAU-AAG7]